RVCASPSALLRRHPLQRVAMTPPSSDERPLLRCALAAVVVVDLVSFIGFIRDARAAAIGAGAAVGSVVEVLSRPTITAVLAFAGAAAAVAFARRAGRLWQRGVGLCRVRGCH